MKNIVSLAEYKADKGIVPARSPYYTSNATQEQIQAAAAFAYDALSGAFPDREPYAIVIGYQDKRGRVKLLKCPCAYPSQTAFESMAGMATMRVVAMIRKDAQ